MRQMGNPSGGTPSFGIKGGDPSGNPPRLDEKGRNPSVNFPQTPSNPLKVSDLSQHEDHHTGHQDLSDAFKAATIPDPRKKDTFTRQEVERMFQLANTKMPSEMEEEKKDSEKGKGNQPQSQLSAPYVAPTNNATDMAKLEALKNVSLASLKQDAIKKWGVEVQNFESRHGRYERNLINMDLRDRIHIRWTSKIYLSLLPERIRLAREAGEDVSSSWLSHEVISSEELTRFLIATASSGTGHEVGDQKHELLNSWLRKQNLLFTVRGLQDSWETFFIQWNRNMELYYPNQDDLEELHHKKIAKELENMVNRGSIHAESVSYIAMPFLHPFLNTTFRKVSVLVSELLSAYEKVMDDVIRNPSFNLDLFKSDL